MSKYIGAQSRAYNSKTKTNALLTTHGKPRFQDYFNLPDTESYFDSPEFKDYCAAVEQVITKQPLTVGGIKRVQGEYYRAEWIQDALEHIGAQLEHKIPERYRK